jgi:hypothetical protein
MCDVSIELWMVVKKDILASIIDRGEWALWEFHARVCSPEVSAIVLGVIKIFQGVFQAVIMDFVWTRV